MGVHEGGGGGGEKATKRQTDGDREGAKVRVEVPPYENNRKSTDNDGNGASYCSAKGVVDMHPEETRAVALPRCLVHL